jgi:hypothetical protein
VKRTVKLTIETERIFVIRTRRAQRRAMCEACGEVVRLVTAEEAAALAHLSTRAVYRLVEAGTLHFIERAGESVLICLNSLGDSQLGTNIGSLTDDSDEKGENHENRK